MKAYSVAIIESEKGFGRKIDDHMICLTRSSCQSFIKQFNARNTDDTTPDWYMMASSDIRTIDITSQEIDYIRAHPNQKVFLSELKGIVKSAEEDLELNKKIHKYLSENLRIVIDKEKNYMSDGSSVEITLTLNGDRIDYDSFSTH